MAASSPHDERTFSFCAECKEWGNGGKARNRKHENVLKTGRFWGRNVVDKHRKYSPLVRRRFVSWFWVGSIRSWVTASVSKYFWWISLLKVDAAANELEEKLKFKFSTLEKTKIEKNLGLAVPLKPLLVKSIIYQVRISSPSIGPPFKLLLIQEKLDVKWGVIENNDKIVNAQLCSRSTDVTSSRQFTPKLSQTNKC